MTVFINNHTTKYNGNGFYVIDLINNINLESIKIISLSYKNLKKRKNKILILKDRKKSQNYFGKVLEILFMYYLILKNITELKNQTIIFTSDPPIIGLLLVLIKKITKSKLIFWCQDIFPNTLVVSNNLGQRSIIFYLLKLINKFIYNKVDKIITISKSMRETLKNEYKISKNKVEIIENWNSLSLKNRIKLKKKNLNIFYNGNISIVHDEKFALNFLNQIKNTDLKFKIFTNSNKIKNKNKPKHVILHKGFLNEKLLYKSIIDSDFQMLFSKSNALKYMYPSKIYNILYYKKPILYFNKDGNDEICRLINHYKIGLNVNSKNQNKIIKLFSETKNIKSLIKLYKNNYKKVIFFDLKKDNSINKWKKLLKCAV